ncbi:MAG: hypothetical protein WD467_03710 [Candidatus Saccharimonadales bacterium]
MENRSQDQPRDLSRIGGYDPTRIDYRREDNELADIGERFADLPNRREAVWGRDAEGGSVYLRHAIARKRYRCPSCQDDIPIGSEHAILGRVQSAQSYDHHHLDFNCVQSVILPSLSRLTVVSPKAASATAVNKRSRQKRNRSRS